MKTLLKKFHNKLYMVYISSSYSVIVWMRVVLKRTVVYDNHQQATLLRPYEGRITVNFDSPPPLRFNFSLSVNTVDWHAKIFVRRSTAVDIPLFCARTLSISKLLRQKLTMDAQGKKSEQKTYKGFFRASYPPPPPFINCA